MTWQGSGGTGGRDDPALDDTRTDLPVAEAPVSADVPATGEALPPPPPVAPPVEPAASALWAAPASDQSPSSGPPPGITPGMSWAPPPPDSSYAVAGVVGLRYADVLPRFVAWFIDVLLLGIIGSVISAFANSMSGGSVDLAQLMTSSTNPLQGDAYGRFLLISFLAALLSTVIDLGYFVLLWTSGGRATLGMRLLKLQIGNAADGRTLTGSLAFRRWLAMGSWVGLFGLVPLVGGLASLALLAWQLVLLVTTASSPTRQGLHDRAAGSAIVQPVSGSGNALVIGCVVIVAILAVTVLVSIVALVFLGGQWESILSAVGESI
jgi:uncharacterized RDD family membrane protein YckC